MRFAIVIFCALILLLLAGVLPVGRGLSATAVYYSPVMIFLLGLLCVSSIKCCLKRRPVGFLLVHLGVVIVLAGGFIGYVAGAKGQIQLPLHRPEAASGLPSGESFGFEVSATDFEVRFYPPVYHLYRELPRDQVRPGRMPYEKVDEFDTSRFQTLEIDGVGRVEVSNLWNEARGEWAPRRMLDSGTFLHLAGQTPSFYGVTLQISDGERELELPVSINHPAGCKGWRFYLMSYDQRSRSYVVLSARHDPGRSAVIAGIWIVMIGTFVLCFRRAGGECRVAGDGEGAV